MPRTRACACGARTNAAYACRGSTKSSVNRPEPRNSRGSSSRGIGRPTHRLTAMAFELWDAELGLSLGTYSDEADALAAVRHLCDTSAGSRAPLGLLEVDDHPRIVATGAQ